MRSPIEQAERTALSSIRVLDFGWYVAVPLTTRMLRDYGAEVIKIETCLRVDAIRVGYPLAPGVTGPEAGMTFHNFNNGKMSVTINLTHPKGRQLARRLVVTADVVADNYKPGVMDKYGLGYEQLRRIRPDIVVLTAPMTGIVGPWRDWRAMGLGIQHLSGLGYASGYPDLPPGPIPLSFPDYCCSPYHAVTAIMAAMRHRRRTGEGQLIELSQYEGMVNFNGPSMLDYAVNGRVEERRGNDSPYFSPHGVFPCEGEDRWIAIAVTNEQEWEGLCRAMGHEAWLADESLRSVRNRMLNKQTIDDRISAWTGNQDGRQLMDALQSAGVPAGVVQRSCDLADDDPQLKERGFYQKVSHPATGEHRHDTRSARFSRTPGKMRGCAPLLGEHNDFVYQQLLGLTEDEVNDLLVEGALD